MRVHGAMRARTLVADGHVFDEAQVNGTVDGQAREGRHILVEPAHNNAVDLDGLKAPGQRRVDAGHGLLEPAQAGDLFKQHGSSVSSEMLTRLSPASLSCGASLGSRAPLVVSEMSSICGIARMSRMSGMIRRPTSGSPPGRRTRRMPPPPPGAQSGRFPRR